MRKLKFKEQNQKKLKKETNFFVTKLVFGFF